jgi:hypothetical protein
MRPIIAIAGGIITAPIWHIWIGLKLIKTTS